MPYIYEIYSPASSDLTSVAYEINEAFGSDGKYDCTGISVGSKIGILFLEEKDLDKKDIIKNMLIDRLCTDVWFKEIGMTEDKEELRRRSLWP